jgi:Tuberculosis necrotizing toxin
VPVDTKLELFGNPDSSEFLAPENIPYRNLAIPPSNLDTFTNDFSFNYHLFLVCMPFDALQGQIAPWFEQPGLGT